MKKKKIILFSFFFFRFENSRNPQGFEYKLFSMQNHKNEKKKRKKKMVIPIEAMLVKCLFLLC